MCSSDQAGGGVKEVRAGKKGVMGAGCTCRPYNTACSFNQ